MQIEYWHVGRVARERAAETALPMIIYAYKYFYRAERAAALLHSKTAEYTQSARIALSLRLSRHLLHRLIRLPHQIYCDGF